MFGSRPRQAHQPSSSQAVHDAMDSWKTTRCMGFAERLNRYFVLPSSRKDEEGGAALAYAPAAARCSSSEKTYLGSLNQVPVLTLSVCTWRWEGATSERQSSINIYTHCSLTELSLTKSSMPIKTFTPHDQSMAGSQTDLHACAVARHAGCWSFWGGRKLDLRQQPDNLSTHAKLAIRHLGHLIYSILTERIHEIKVHELHSCPRLVARLSHWATT
ncbi:hypothetical protein WAI453_005221 [Rhynchosporium graminicola]